MMNEIKRINAGKNFIPWRGLHPNTGVKEIGKELGLCLLCIEKIYSETSVTLLMDITSPDLVLIQGGGQSIWNKYTFNSFARPLYYEIKKHDLGYISKSQLELIKQQSAKEERERILGLLQIYDSNEDADWDDLLYLIKEKRSSEGGVTHRESELRVTEAEDAGSNPAPAKRLNEAEIHIIGKAVAEYWEIHAESYEEDICTSAMKKLGFNHIMTDEETENDE